MDLVPVLQKRRLRLREVSAWKRQGQVLTESELAGLQDTVQGGPTSPQLPAHGVAARAV